MFNSDLTATCIERGKQKVTKGNLAKPVDLSSISQLDIDSSRL